MENKYINRYRTFCKCIDNLKKSKNANPSEDFVLEGTIMNFNLTFDIAWKVMKDILVQYYAITGFVAGSPREVLRESFKAELIQGDEWMDMLKVRNQQAHDYDGVIVKKYCHIIVDEYIGKFEEFQRKVDSLFYNI